MEQREDFEFDGCQINIYRNNKKVAILIEYGKPMALIALASFIHILGEPLNHCYEPGDEFVLFLFNEKQEDISLAKWKEIFGITDKQIR